MCRYLEDRNRLGLPDSQLCETSCEAITVDPLGELRRIYSQLELKDPEAGLGRVTAYLEEIGDCRTNRHAIRREDAERIRERWRFSFEEWGYDLDPPPDVVIG